MACVFKKWKFPCHWFWHFFFQCSCDVYSLYLFHLKQLWKRVRDSVSPFPYYIALSLLSLMRGNPSSHVRVHM